ncbi:hypothetical protein Bbelb_223990 [Branchiostoma belcheri]|nr:hypothetical protein Bbelb_223990 [Branchiostoma belcheri]
MSSGQTASAFQTVNAGRVTTIANLLQAVIHDWRVSGFRWSLRSLAPRELRRVNGVNFAAETFSCPQGKRRKTDSCTDCRLLQSRRFAVTRFDPPGRISALKTEGERALPASLNLRLWRRRLDYCCLAVETFSCPEGKRRKADSCTDCKHRLLQSSRFTVTRYDPPGDFLTTAVWQVRCSRYDPLGRIPALTLMESASLALDAASLEALRRRCEEFGGASSHVLTTAVRYDPPGRISALRLMARATGVKKKMLRVRRREMRMRKRRSVQSRRRWSRPRGGFSPVPRKVKELRILDTEQDYFLRGMKEPMYIRAHHSSLNRDGGRHRLPDTFDPVLTSHFKEAT